MSSFLESSFKGSFLEEMGDNPRSGEIKSGEVRSGEFRSGEIRRCNELKSGELKSAEMRSGELKTGLNMGDISKIANTKFNYEDDEGTD